MSERSERAPRDALRRMPTPRGAPPDDRSICHPLHHRPSSSGSLAPPPAPSGRWRSSSSAWWRLRGDRPSTLDEHRRRDTDEAATMPIDADADVSDEVIEEEAPLDEPVAEPFSTDGDHLPEVDAVEVVPDNYAEVDETADEAAALYVGMKARRSPTPDRSADGGEPVVLDATIRGRRQTRPRREAGDIRAGRRSVDPSGRVVRRAHAVRLREEGHRQPPCPHPEHEHGGQDLRGRHPDGGRRRVQERQEADGAAQGLPRVPARALPDGRRVVVLHPQHPRRHRVRRTEPAGPEADAAARAARC